MTPNKLFVAGRTQNLILNVIFYHNVYFEDKKLA